MATNQPDFGLTVAAVARRLGVAPATLRTWDRRYGLGPSEHRDGAHRRYTAGDIARLDTMKQLVLNGLRPSEAARIALEGDKGAASLVPQATPQLRVVQPDDSDGVVIALAGPRASATALERAAKMLDGASCEQIVGHLFDDHSIVWVWTEVLTPLLTKIGMRWEQEQRGIEVEHVLSAAVEHQLRVVHTALNDPINARPVLLACAPHELHTLPIYAIAGALAEKKITSRVLGARLPAESLIDAAERIGPCAIVVWSQQRGTADETVWDSFSGVRSGTVLMAAGPGWVDELPSNVLRSVSFPDTLITLAAAAGSS